MLNPLLLFVILLLNWGISDESSMSYTQIHTGAHMRYFVICDNKYSTYNIKIFSKFLHTLASGACDKRLKCNLVFCFGPLFKGERVNCISFGTIFSFS